MKRVYQKNLAAANRKYTALVAIIRIIMIITDWQCDLSQLSTYQMDKIIDSK